MEYSTHEMHGFARNDSGAVTVDWVVLTAGLVGLGLATLGIVTAGVENASTQTRDELARDDIISTSFARLLGPAAHGLIATVSHASGEDITELSRATAFSFGLDATLSGSDTGILFEVGGTGYGTILYQHHGFLYLQSGASTYAGAGTDTGEAVWEVQDGNFLIEGSIDSATGLALYVDGELVSTDTFSATYVAGLGVGRVGGGASTVAANHGDFDDENPHSGAGEFTLYLDQTTGDETGV